jgi:hypothetical protein
MNARAVSIPGASDEGRIGVLAFVRIDNKGVDMNKLITTLALGIALALPAGAAFAQAAHPPAQNVGKRHPNLEAAQRLCLQAFKKLTASQAANEFDEGGHAAKAKDLLDQVNQQIKMAAETDNSKGK